MAIRDDVREFLMSRRARVTPEAVGLPGGGNRRVTGLRRSEVADLTVAATEKVTRKTLTPEDQKRLVDEALGELDFTALGGERR